MEPPKKKFLVQQIDLKQKYKVDFQKFIGLFYPLNTLTQIRLNHTWKSAVGRCKSLYVRMVVLFFLRTK